MHAHFAMEGGDLDPLFIVVVDLFIFLFIVQFYFFNNDIIPIATLDSLYHEIINSCFLMEKICGLISFSFFQLQHSKFHELFSAAECMILL